MAIVIDLSQTPRDEAVARVAEVLMGGGIAVLPTDTVYGLAQSVAANPLGARGLFGLKRRPLTKTIPLMVSTPDDVKKYAAGSCDAAAELARAFWPGPLTIVVNASPEVPAPYVASDGTVAMRMSADGFVPLVAGAVGGLLATTSANTSSQPSPKSFDEVESRIIEGADICVRGSLPPSGLASSIVDCAHGHPTLLRFGAITQEQIDAVLDRTPSKCHVGTAALPTKGER